jgi:hypothetical protein
MMEGPIRQMLDKAMHAHAEYERAWWKNERCGRWVVLEPGPGRLLKDSPKHLREYVDAITLQRGRRFRSLSRARAFAREVGGVVRRWKRHMHRRVGDRSYKTTWRYETNPWKHAVEQTASMRLSPWALLDA